MWISVFRTYILLSSLLIALNVAEGIRPRIRNYGTFFEMHRDPYYEHDKKTLSERFTSKLQPDDDICEESSEEGLFRLPNSSMPLHYDIELSTDIHIGKLDFFGKVAIEVRILRDCEEIVLHKRRLDINEVTIQKENQETPLPMEHKFEKIREFLTLTPKDKGISFKKYEIWTIKIRYNGTLRDDAAGFFYSSYSGRNNTLRYLAVTQFESTDARHGFPCYDEPSQRATFTITIKHDPSYFALSNMPVDTDESSTGVTVFKRTLKMPTYSVAFVVSDFKLKKSQIRHLPLRIGSRPGTEHTLSWALIVNMRVMVRLAEYFMVPYVFPKMDMLAIPDFKDAMENWGLCIYGEKLLQYNPKDSTIISKTLVSTTIAHELTHQWFGNYVTPKWWSFLWLKEGFAELFEVEIIDQVYPEWDIYQYFHTDVYQLAMVKDSNENSAPMTRYVQSTKEIEDLYDSISYAKSGCVLSMWQHALTDKVFRQGLHIYLVRNKFGAAEENDLFDAIQKAADDQNYEIPDTIQAMISTWTHQRGYPILNVKRNYVDGSFMIYQKSFYDDVAFHDSRVWCIPLNFATESKFDFKDTRATHFMLNTKELLLDEVQVPNNEWLLLNKQSTGYYRINYDEKNWLLLAEGLKTEPYKIHLRNRAQILDDASTLCFSQRVSHNILMEILSYLSDESEYAPWKTGSKILFKMNAFLKYEPKYNLFQNFVKTLVKNIHEELGFEERSEDTYFQKYTREVAINLACMAGIESCLANSKKKLYAYIEEDSAISPTLQEAIYCNGLMESSDYLFDFFFRELLASKDKLQRARLSASLGCSRSENHLIRIMESCIDKDIELSVDERKNMFESICSTRGSGMNVCLSFLTHFRLLANMTGLQSIDIFDRVSYAVIENNDMDVFTEFVNSVLKKNNPAIVDRLMLNVNATREWVRINNEPIMNCLEPGEKDEKGEKGDTANRARRHTPSLASLSLILMIGLWLAESISMYC